ncbi:MAG: bifunctional folylpolyglutamate synthase/dihydrofolate synthase, partial [Flavobacteriales bacterium]
MNYSETIEYLFNKLPIYQRSGKSAYKADIGNIVKASEILGNPHLNFKSAHIAGTNGKGSTAHMISSVLQESGYKIGLYTSPHLKDFRERIR